jgi:hypothetical protein
VRWFEKFPERLDHELRALADAGFAPEIDEAQRASGVIVVSVQVPVLGKVEAMRITFPPQYPFFAFQIEAPTLSLGRHQDPYNKVLCFLENVETEWNTNDTAAAYLTDRLSLILASNSDPSLVPEGREGAPATGFMRFHPNTNVFVGDWNLPMEPKYGTLRIGLEQNTDPNQCLRGAILEVRGSDGTLLAQADEQIKARFGTVVAGRWVRLPKRPKSDDPFKIVEEASLVESSIKICEFRGGPDVLGVVFADEAKYLELHDIWTFVVRLKERKTQGKIKGRRPPGDNLIGYLARPDIASPAELVARVPRVRPLSAKKVAIFGVGAIGSMVAWQLARAGAKHLALIDHDFYQTGTTPRWLLGLPAAGYAKVDVLSQFFLLNYPYIEVTRIPYRVGDPNAPPDKVDEIMSAALDGADLVVDCTVEFAVNHYLSTVSRERGIQYIYARGTTGAWGGIVMRAQPDPSAPCWKCFYTHMANGAYGQPAAEDTPDVQPVGCFSPTFTGTGFDMDHISLMATRLAVGMLCSDTEGAYPNFNWDIGVVNIWTQEGEPIAPSWKTFPLVRHPDCDNH